METQQKQKTSPNIYDSLDTGRLKPGNKKSLTLPPDEVFTPLDARGVSVEKRKDQIGMKITQFTSYLLAPSTGLKLDGVCRPEAPKVEKELFDAYAKICDSVMGEILRGIDIKNLKEFWLAEDGKLTMYFTDNSDEKPTIRDVSTIWNQVVKNNIPLYLPTSEHLSEIQRMQARARQEARVAQEQLQENLETEVFMGGIVQFFYESTPAQVAHTTIPMVALGWLAYGVWRGTTRALKKIAFRDSNWKIQVIDTIKHPIQWSKDWMKKNFLQVLERFDFNYDPKTRWFYNPEIYSFGKVQDMMKTMSYDRYKKLVWNNAVSETEWNRIKKELSEADITSFYKWLTRGQKIDDTIKIFLKNNLLEAVFYPVAFEYFRRNQTDTNFIRGISGWSAAIAGVKIGKRAPGGWIVKFVAGALAWAGMMMYSDSELTSSVNKWRYFFSKDAGEYTWHQKSKLGHALSTFGLNEAWDVINRYVLPWWDKLPIDINMLPRVDLLRLPKVPIIQSSISIGMNPWEWLRDSAVRDVDDWNKMVPDYTEKLIRDSLELVRAFQKKDMPFYKWDWVAVLRTKLEDLVFSGSGYFFSDDKEIMIDTIIAESSSWNGGKSEAVIIDVLRSRGSDLLINPENLKKRKDKLEEKKNAIVQRTWVLMTHIQTPITKQTFAFQLAQENFERPISIEAQKIFIGRLFDRMISWVEIAAPSKWVESNLLWTRSRKLILSEDIIILQTLLNADRKIGWDLSTFNMSQYFAKLLDDMSEYTQEFHFIDQVLSWNKKWYDWHI